jgi:hypothetical protein
MSQTATWAVPSAPSGLAMRNTVNTIVDVLRSNSSGAAAPSPTVAGMFWFDESVSPAVLRQRNASNTAWNRIIDTADAAASRSALSAMAQPTFSAGLGQVAGVYADQNTNFAAPAGGTWWGRWQRRNKTTLGNNGQGVGIYAGGSAILAVANNEDCFGDFIRIA